MVYYISEKGNESGYHGNPQSTRFPGSVALPNNLLGDYISAKGFVDLTVENGVVVSLTVNQEALDKYNEEHPEVPEPDPEPSEIEQLRAAVFMLQANAAPVMAAATAYAKTATEIPDDIALDMTELFPTWEEVLAAGEELPEGRIINDAGQLYRVAQPVTPKAHQAPHNDGMLAVYRPIDKGRAGTAEDPIPWVYGMDCMKGLYYTYEGTLWLCKGDMKPCVWAPGSAGLWQWEAVTNDQ